MKRSSETEGTKGVFIKPPVFLLPLRRTYSRTGMKYWGRGERQRETHTHPQPNTHARARQFSELIVSELGYWLDGGICYVTSPSEQRVRE